MASRPRQRGGRAAARRKVNGSRIALIVIIGLLLLAVLLLVLWLAVFRKPSRSTDIGDTIVVDMTSPENEEYGRIYHHPLEETHIAEKDGIAFVDNEILVVAASGVNREQIASLAEQYNAEIVGEIEVSGDYQLQLDEVRTLDALNVMAEQLDSEDSIASASLNYVFSVSAQSAKEEQHAGFFYGEKWQNDLQDYNDNSGKSWGIEAINTFDAWNVLAEYADQVQPVRVGLIDTGFDIGHEDLGFAETFYDNGMNGLNTPDKDKDHGTHVAGTMAANADDTTGICGVYPYGRGRLYGVVNCGEYGALQYNDNIFSEMESFAELLVRDVKVINSSRGATFKKDLKGKNEEEKRAWWIEELPNSRNPEETCLIGDFLNRMLQKGYDFVIVSAAGNNSSKKTGHLESRYCSVYNYMDPELFPDVYDRIIVVGAINKNFNIAAFSNGGERTDIYAPGSAIYSTLPGNTWFTLNSANYMRGTSMASPHVAGAAAIVWSVNPSLTGSEVKEIICASRSSREIYDVSDYKSNTPCYLLDAGLAARTAAEWTVTENPKSPQNGGLLGCVYEKQRYDQGWGVEYACITLTEATSGKVVTDKTDRFGEFEIMAPEGDYYMTITADGYEDYAWRDGKETLHIANEGITYVGEDILMNRLTDSEMSVSVVATIPDTEEHYYEILKMNNITGKQAIQICKERNGYLAHIENDKENNLLSTMLDSYSIQYAFFGYSDEDEEGVWKWLDGAEPSDDDYTHWRTGEPNNEKELEHYSALYPDGSWNDEKFDKESFGDGVYVICEYGTNPDDNPFRGEYEGHTYELFEEELSWTDAQIRCHEMGGHLATIHSSGEQVFLTRLMKASEKENFWLGGHYLHTQPYPKWVWVDNSLWSYENWEEDQPDCLNGVEFYLRIKNRDHVYEEWTAYDGKWNDTAESGDEEVPLSTFGFICEWD